MKDTACEDTIQVAYKWRCCALIAWSAPLAYGTVYLSPLILGYSPSQPNLTLFLRFLSLLGFLAAIKVWNFKNFPEGCKYTDELRKLFTQIGGFHGLLVGGMVLYPALFKELAYCLGYNRLSESWLNTLGAVSGLVSALCYIMRHEYLLIWYIPYYGRMHWLVSQVPSCMIKASAMSLVSLCLSSVAWIVMHDYRTDFSQIHLYWGLGAIINLVETLVTHMGKNFIAKRVYLGDINSLGEQLSVSGLVSESEETQFQCFQDLLDVSFNDEIRKNLILIVNPDQWQVVFEKAIKKIEDISEHLRTFDSRKASTLEMPSVEHLPKLNQGLQKIAYFLYYTFNEPFECRFRNQTFKMLISGVLASNTLTNFMLSTEYTLKDESVAKLLDAESQALSNLAYYKQKDSEINSAEFETVFSKNIIKLGEAFKHYIPSLPLRLETKEIIMKLQNGCD
mmetsp:Transcript_3487/g.5366  ORF Transcript_3487/g.5366 Transcript_3487/m.5366 type:complete len:450 (+) Transcript_3487:34-1383(+)